MSPSYFIIPLSRAIQGSWGARVAEGGGSSSFHPAGGRGRAFTCIFSASPGRGLEKTKTVSELFPARASSSRRGPDTGMCPGDVSWRKKGLFCLCDEFCKDWDRSAGSGGSVPLGRGKNKVAPGETTSKVEP